MSKIRGTMAVYCDDECAKTGPVCDYCRWFSWNIDARRAAGDNRTCTLKNKRTEPDLGCQDFHCACDPSLSLKP